MVKKTRLEMEYRRFDPPSQSFAMKAAGAGFLARRNAVPMWTGSAPPSDTKVCDTIVQLF